MDVFACFPGGEVLTLNGDVSPEDLVEFPGFADVCVVFRGGVLLAGAGPVVLRSWGEATPVEDVESAYLQLAFGF